MNEEIDIERRRRSAVAAARKARHERERAEALTIFHATLAAETQRAAPGERARTLLKTARAHVAGRASRAELTAALFLLRRSRQFDLDDIEHRRARTTKACWKVLLPWERKVASYVAHKIDRQALRKVLPKGRDRELSTPPRKVHPAIRRIAQREADAGFFD